MKAIFSLSVFFLLSFSVAAQDFRKGDEVEVDQLMSSSRRGTWEKGTVTNVDIAGKLYTVKLANGREAWIPSRNPEVWIRKAVATAEPPVKTRPVATTGLPDDDDEIITTSCDTTEKNVRQWIRQQVNNVYANYDKRVVSFKSFKAGPGYTNSDPGFGRINVLVKPFWVEFTVDLVNEYKQGGQEYSSHKIWKFKRKYIMYKNQAGICEFGIAEGTVGELILSESN